MWNAWHAKQANLKIEAATLRVVCHVLEATVLFFVISWRGEKGEMAMWNKGDRFCHQADEAPYTKCAAVVCCPPMHTTNLRLTPEMQIEEQKRRKKPISGCGQKYKSHHCVLLQPSCVTYSTCDDVSKEASITSLPLGINFTWAPSVQRQVTILWFTQSWQILLYLIVPNQFHETDTVMHSQPSE